MRSFAMVVLALVASGCVGGQDNPTMVKDLRVLGMRFEPPEVLMKGCDVQLLLNASGFLDGGQSLDGGAQLDAGIPFQLLVDLITPVEFTGLIADPTGAGRMLDYRLSACANRGDRACNTEGDFVEISSGQTTAGEVAVRMEFQLDGGRPLPLKTLGDGVVDGGTPLLFEVLNQDTFKGLGGIRIPVVLEVSAPDTGERIYAQKLMVYTCKFFPSMTQNVSPVLPGLTFAGEPWPENEVREVSGYSEVRFEAEDFSALEEFYVVPSLELQPVELTESWKITWLTNSGSMSDYNTGGTDVGGQSERHRSTWRPDQSATTPREVDFTFVVRDGRGGSSWTQRKVRWTP